MLRFGERTEGAKKRATRWFGSPEKWDFGADEAGLGRRRSGLRVASMCHGGGEKFAERRVRVYEFGELMWCSAELHEQCDFVYDVGCMRA